MGGVGHDAGDPRGVGELAGAATGYAFVVLCEFSVLFGGLHAR